MEDNLAAYLRYTGIYPRTQGLLYVFSVEGIDFSSNMAGGYFFDPACSQWVEGMFPLPDAIQRRIRVVNSIRLRLKEISNGRFFNCYRMDKWEYWEWASRNESLLKHLPDTRKLSSEVLSQMLGIYGAVVLKPLRGSEGFGFTMVKKNGSKYSVQRKWEKRPAVFANERQMLAYVNRISRKRPYLVQQAIDLLQFDKRYADFRIVMQKGFSCRWQHVGIIVSMGAVGGICSNYPRNESVFLSFEELFSRYLGLSSAEIASKKQQVIDTCIKACEVLDLPDCYYGDVGIDLAIDKSFNMWILEVNTIPLDELFLYLGDEDAYDAVHSNRIEYLTALSGFNLFTDSSGEGDHHEEKLQVCPSVERCD